MNIETQKSFTEMYLIVIRQMLQVFRVAFFYKQEMDGYFAGKHTVREIK